MDEVSEYRRHAQRCRELAAKADGAEKKYLVDMAAEWTSAHEKPARGSVTLIRDRASTGMRRVHTAGEAGIQSILCPCLIEAPSGPHLPKALGALCFNHTLGNG